MCSLRGSSGHRIRDGRNSGSRREDRRPCLDRPPRSCRPSTRWPPRLVRVRRRPGGRVCRPCPGPVPLPCPVFSHQVRHGFQVADPACREGIHEFVVSARDEIDEDRCRRCSVGQTPFREARGHQDAFCHRGSTDIGEAICGVVVLGRPPILERVDIEVFVRPPLQFPPPPRGQRCRSRSDDSPRR